MIAVLTGGVPRAVSEWLQRKGTQIVRQPDARDVVTFYGGTWKNLAQNHRDLHKNRKVYARSCVVGENSTLTIRGIKPT